jgi:hypothetical protein
MTLWTEYQNALEHHNALLHESEQCRLARKALEGRQKDQVTWMKGMKSLRSRLSTWGIQLQERYRTTAAASNFVASHSK